MTTTTFTALEPTLHTGLETVPVEPAQLAFAAAGADGDMVPISSTMLTLVFLKNDSGSNYDVTFPANVYTETAGGAGEGLGDATVLATGNAITMAGVFLPYRFANPSGYCAIDYGGGVASISVAVAHVPYTSK
jgi:hypothetical protein